MRRVTLFALLFALVALTAVAADVTGKWTGQVEMRNGTREVVLNLEADGDKLTGTMSGMRGDTEISDGKISGDDISFVVVRNFNGNEFKINYAGKVSGKEMNLTSKFTTPSGNERTQNFTLKKAE